jgi:hypothetical protein
VSDVRQKRAGIADIYTEAATAHGEKSVFVPRHRFDERSSQSSDLVEASSIEDGLLSHPSSGAWDLLLDDIRDKATVLCVEANRHPASNTSKNGITDAERSDVWEFVLSANPSKADCSLVPTEPTVFVGATQSTENTGRIYMVYMGDIIEAFKESGFAGALTAVQHDCDFDSKGPIDLGSEDISWVVAGTPTPMHLSLQARYVAE